MYLGDRLWRYLPVHQLLAVLFLEAVDHKLHSVAISLACCLRWNHSTSAVQSAFLAAHLESCE